MRKGIKNVLIGVLGQLLIMGIGIVVPRFILTGYGDEANGLISSIGQLFTYLALIEAGVGQASLQALYKPIAENDFEQIKKVIKATRRMFGKLTVIYLVVVASFAFLYPLIITINNIDSINIFGSSYFAVFLLVLFQGASNAIGFYYTATLKQLLTADGYNYLIVDITTAVRLATSIIRILLMNLRVNIVCLQAVYVVIAVIEALLYKAVIYKKYPWLDDSSNKEEYRLSQKNSFVVHEISNVIFNSTDVLILSIFCDLSIASIYAIYNLVFGALNTLINQVHSGCFYVLGQSYALDKNRYVKIHDTYDTYYIAFVFSLISTAYLLIIPFIELYTSDVTSLQYTDEKLPILFALIQLLSCCRITSSNLIKISGHVKATIPRSIAEAVINLAVSLLLVNIIGIYGVLLGTIIALLYRTNDMIIYANRNILNRSIKRTYKTVLLNSAIFAVVIVIGRLWKITNITSYSNFFKYAAIICTIMCLFYFGINTILFKDSRSVVMDMINKKNK